MNDSRHSLTDDDSHTHFHPSSSSPAVRVCIPSAPALQLSSSYRKKTASRQLPKELYLRTDLPCRTLLCDRNACTQQYGSVSTTALSGVLDPHAIDHYLLPNWEALQRFLPLFGRSTLIHLFLLRTHAQLAGSAMTRHLRTLLADNASTRRVVLFENETHAETHTIQRANESLAQRNQRAVRRAAKWMHKHIKGKKKIILIEEDEGPTEESIRREEEEREEQKKKMAAEEKSPSSASNPSSRVYPRESVGITIHSMSSYLTWLHSHPSVLSTPTSLDEVSSLMTLHQDLVDAERIKVVAKIRKLEADQTLQEMLDKLKVELKRTMSQQSKEAAAAGAAATAAESAPPTAVTPLAPSPTPSPSALLSPTSSPSPSPSPPAPSSSSPSASSDAEYDEHLSRDLALEAIRRGLLLRGHLHVNKYHAQQDASLDLGGRMVDLSTGSVIESSAIKDTSGLTNAIFIHGMADRNRAIDGDEVAIQLLPKSMWKAPTLRKKLAAKDAPGAGSKGGAEGGEEEEDDSLHPDSRVVPTGRVVSILQTNRRPYVCTLQLDEGGSGGDYSLVVPMNECIPKIRIRTHQVAALANQRLLVQIEEWPRDSKYPSGLYLKSLGRIGRVETGVACILQELQISHPPFSINQLAVLPDRRVDPASAADPKYKVGSGFHARGPRDNPFAWEVPPEALVGRIDLRVSHRDAICSIDPVGCEDIDDALSVRFLEKSGRVEMGVHIADPTYFVPAGSALDLEASRRATSVYLVDRRLDMLPSTLSADLCSLRGGCDRLAISLLWEMDPKTGEVFRTWYGRTVIYNSYALSYEEAQLILDTEGGTKPIPTLPPDHPDAHLTLTERYDEAPNSSLTPLEKQQLYPKIQTLVHLARQLRQRRLERGALELDSLAVSFKLDETKQVVGVRTEAELELHSTIAEWMVFANSVVAYTIFQRLPGSALLRRHPYPNPNRFEKLLEMAKNLELGHVMDVSSNKSLAESLRKAEKILYERQRDQRADQGSKDLAGPQSAYWLLKLLKSLASRAMSEAQYFSTGSVGHQGAFYHYGLSADFYTHFTSPIRRYADIVVHRQLLEVIRMEREEFAVKKKAIKAGEKEPVSNALHSSTLSTSTPSLLLSNEQLSALTQHLNDKNRNAKMAGFESHDLFLACYLAGQPTGEAARKEEEEAYGYDFLSEPASSSTLAPLQPRVERCDALIVSLRSNGFIVLLPRYHVKGALLLVDREGRAVVSHPMALEAGVEESGGMSMPNAQVELNEAKQQLTLTLSAPLPSPTSSSSLPLSRTFSLFQPVQVDVTLRPNASRYRTPKPVFTLVWQGEQTAKKGKQKVARREGGPVEEPPTRSTASSSAAAPSPFSMGPAAPLGTKKKPSSSLPSGLASSPLYKLLSMAAALPPPPPAHTTASVEEVESIPSKAPPPSSAPPRDPFRSRTRVKHKYSGAFGGRLFLTPSGDIPAEMKVVQRGKIGPVEEGGEEEEDY